MIIRYALGQITPAILLSTTLVTLACRSENKAPECKVLVTSLGELGERLEEVRYTVSGTEVKPAEVIEVLRPFSSTAKKVAAALNETKPAAESMRKISMTAGAAASALSTQATQMADLAERMADVEAISKAVDERKERVDKLELVIKEICVATPNDCTDISGVLARFPAPTDQADVTEDAHAWTHKLNAWADEVAKVIIKDSTLNARVTEFVKNWRELSQSMDQLVAALEVSKKYEALTKEFNEQLKVANKAIADANTQCETKP